MNEVRSTDRLAGHQRVEVRVGDPRDDERAVEVDHGGGRAGGRERRRADRDDPIPGDSDRIGPGVGGCGEDPRVPVERVGHRHVVEGSGKTSAPRSLGGGIGESERLHDARQLAAVGFGGVR